MMNGAELAPVSASPVSLIGRYIDVGGDDWAYDNSLSSFVAAYDDGRCLIAREKATDPEVRRLLQEIERRFSLQLKREYVDLGLIAEARRSGVAGRRGQADGGMQGRILDMIEQAHKANASDIHIEVGSEVTTVKLRVHGRLNVIATWPAEMGEKFLGAAYYMADLANKSFTPAKFLAARLAPREGRDDWAFPEGLEAVRMQFNPVAFGTNYAVFRLLRVTSETETIESLGYEPEQLVVLTEFASRSKGLLIISGPTGSGKSTTLCSLMRRTYDLDVQAGNMRARFTVEDPPERRLPGAQQLVVQNTDDDGERGKAFNDAIRAALRSDPDIIMVGEIRDDKTADIVMSASMTGHSVLSTMHTATAHAIPMRLIDLGVDRSVIFGSDELYAATAQVLVPLLCTSCRVSGDEARAQGMIDDEQFDRFTRAFGSHFFIEGKGCPSCGGKGIHNRTVVAEVIRTDHAYLEVASSQGIVAAREFSRARGELSMADVGKRKVQRGEVCAREVARIVDINELLQTTGTERLAA